jgi:hemerythrin
MSFQIQSIVLYNNKGDVREVKFNSGAVNIITGASKTGKSALIHIVDYCLGSGSCGVPAGVILKTVSWFGIVLIKEREQFFIARKKPRMGKLTSSEFYIERGTDLSIPRYEDLVPNTNTDALKIFLSEFAGISEYTFDPGAGYTRNPGHADVRKALTYCFQEQSEVANQRYLFHRQGEQFIPQSIKDFMPFFLGVVDKDYVLKKEALRKLRRDLRKIESERAAQERIRGAALDRSHALIAEAISVGLLSQDTKKPQTWETVKNLLFEALNVSIEHNVSETDYMEEINNLLDEQRELRVQHSYVAEEIRSLRTLKARGTGFADEAVEQQSRLSSLGLLAVDSSDQHSCPFCDASLENPIPGSELIQKNLIEISAQLDGVSSDMPHIDRLIITAEEKKSGLEEQVNNIDGQIKAVQQSNKLVEQVRDQNAKRALIKGRLDLYMESIQKLGDDKAGIRDDSFLKAKIKALEDEVGDGYFLERYASVLSVLSREMTLMADALELEHSGNPVRLDPSKLTVIVDADGESIPLDRMGSGDNWVSLHVIVHLVLHSWFIRKKLPVPGFIIFDQPTQAYFPPDTSGDTIRDSDSIAVSRMFQMMIETVKKAGFQVIVTDHADLKAEWYQDVVIDKWWDGVTKLVPVDWL